MFDDCSCYNPIAITPSQLSRMTQAAIQHALHAKGVAVVGLPGDVTTMDAVDNITSDHNFNAKVLIWPTDEELQKLASLVNKYEKICIFCGIGAENAHDEVVQLAAKIKALVGYSFRGKMYIQHNNPYEVGMTGLPGFAIRIP